MEETRGSTKRPSLDVGQLFPFARRHNINNLYRLSRLYMYFKHNRYVAMILRLRRHPLPNAGLICDHLVLPAALTSRPKFDNF